MKLSEILQQLTSGEFTSLFAGGIEQNRITPDQYPRVIPHINLGLIELYKRFPILLRTVIIQQNEAINRYHLEYRYAQTNTTSTEPVKYIMDTTYEPFRDDVLKIERVFNEDGQELYLNDPKAIWSVYTVGHKTIQIPYPDRENILEIEYRASPELISLEPDLEKEIYLSYTFLEPLLFYMAARIYTALDTDNNQSGQLYYQKFEQSCKKIESLGLVNTDNTSNYRLEENSWV